MHMHQTILPHGMWEEKPFKILNKSIDIAREEISHVNIDTKESNKLLRSATTSYYKR